MSELDRFEKQAAPLAMPQRWGWLRRALSFLYPFLILGLLWEVSVRAGWIRTSALPPPSVVMGEFWRLAVVEGVLWKHVGSSLYRLVAGYALAILIGTATGALLSLNETLRALFRPALGLLISVPTIAWVPVLLITMGLGDRTVITTVFLGGYFAITYNTMRGIEMLPRNLVQAARLMGVRGPGLFFKVMLPGSMVSIITGLRLGIGYSWRALVGGEFLSAMIQWGIGKMVYEARFWNDANMMMAGIVLIGISGFLLDRALLRWLEKATVEKWGMLARR